jgi:CRP-like cAMP-binding protein
MPDLFERVLLLKEAPIFADIEMEDLRLVAQVLEEEPCFRGDLVFVLDDPSDRMYIVNRGKIGICMTKSPTEKDVVRVIEPKDCFGEMGMFNDSPRSASALVLEGGILLALNKEKLKGLIIRYPELAIGLLATLSARLRDLPHGAKIESHQVSDPQSIS